MEELKNKFIEAIKSIDFNTLTLYELQEVSSIAKTVDELERKDYLEVLSESMKDGFGYSSTYKSHKTIGEMKGGE